MIEIRLAEREDADALCDAHVAGWRTGYRGLFADEYLDADAFDSDRRVNWRLARWLDGPEQCMFAGILDGRAVGFAHVGPERSAADAAISEGRSQLPHGEVFGFYLHPTAWGSGVASALMEAAEEWLRAHGFTEAVLWVLRDNPRGRGFYEKVGWSWSGQETLWAGPKMPGVEKPDPIAEVQYSRQL